MFKAIMKWNEDQKAKGKARRAELTERMKNPAKPEWMQKVDAKLAASVETARQDVEAAKVGLKQSTQELKAAGAEFKRECSNIKQAIKEAKESPEYQELKAKSDKQGSFGWKLLKWGFILLLAGPVLGFVGASILIMAG